VGLLRIEDVAIGCLVSLVVGVLFWPRGAASVVGDDLADAFRRGAAYLTQSVDWALGTRHEPPDTGAAAVTAGIRLDEALRGFLAEQGTKRVSKEDLWMLVMASMRLRLTAYSLAGLRAPEHLGHTHHGTAYARAALTHATTDQTDFYERVAVLVGRPAAGQVLLPVKVPSFAGLDGTTSRAAGDGEESRGGGGGQGRRRGRARGRRRPGPRYRHPASPASAMGARALAAPQLARPRDHRPGRARGRAAARALVALAPPPGPAPPPRSTPR
jgi:hypothetical protein